MEAQLQQYGQVEEEEEKKISFKFHKSLLKTFRFWALKKKKKKRSWGCIWVGKQIKEGGEISYETERNDIVVWF